MRSLRSLLRTTAAKAHIWSRYFVSFPNTRFSRAPLAAIAIKEQTKMQALDQALKERLDHVYWSIYLYNTSLTELRIISDIPYNESELLIANSHPFSFYRVTLQYSFIMEYNKLLEKGRIDRKQNISSLFQLNEVIHSSCGKAFEAKFLENEDKLSSIKGTDFYNRIRVLRDKKFAHADDHEANIPFKIKGFKSEDIEQGFSHLSIIKEILKNCTLVNIILIFYRVDSQHLIVRKNQNNL